MSRVAEFQAHAAPDVALFEHGTAPRGTVDIHQHGFRAEDRMAGNQSLAGAAVLNRVSAVLGADFEYRAGWEIAEMHTPFDLGLTMRPLTASLRCGLGMKTAVLKAEVRSRMALRPFWHRRRESVADFAGPRAGRVPVV